MRVLTRLHKLSTQRWKVKGSKVKEEREIKEKQKEWTGGLDEKKMGGKS